MGYFSRYDVELQEAKLWNTRPEFEVMTAWLDVLWERLEELMQWCEEPEYRDRYFYRDHVTACYELPNTVQGTLDAIAVVTERMGAKQEQERQYELWVETVRATGATPDGQLVLPGSLYPLRQLQMEAA